jgi:hypothetical protein
MGCKYTPKQARDEHSSGTAAGYTYRVTMMCKLLADDGGCEIPHNCTTPRGTMLHRIDRKLPDDAEWETRGFVCLREDEDITQTVTPEMVLTEFRGLAWPSAELTVQPPDGQTLVNLETIFHTTDTGPLTRTVTLLGQTIRIEATPVEWTWHPDRGQQGWTTTEPGRPYPRHTISHVYTRSDVTVRPSVDVTYSGRYRVNDDAWTDIPGTHTVTGAPVVLDVLEARPLLVR